MYKINKYLVLVKKKPPTDDIGEEDLSKLKGIGAGVVRGLIRKYKKKLEKPNTPTKHNEYKKKIIDYTNYVNRVEEQQINEDYHNR
jgi:hypothetical protein